jgi:hypothetical protein
MKKITVILSLIVLMGAVSVQAQKGSTITPNPLPSITPQYDNLITVEDETTGSYLVFHVPSGEYKFIRCSDGAAMSGVGKVKIDGCAIYLEDVQQDHRVLASVNQCAQEGKAAIERFAVKGQPFAVQELKEYLSDNNMRDNTQSCSPKIVTKP